MLPKRKNAKKQHIMVDICITVFYVPWTQKHLWLCARRRYFTCVCFITEAVHSSKQGEALLRPYLDVGKCKRSSVWSLKWCTRFLPVYSGCLGCEDLPQATIDLWTLYSQLGEDEVHFFTHHFLGFLHHCGCVSMRYFENIFETLHCYMSTRSHTIASVPI